MEVDVIPGCTSISLGLCQLALERGISTTPTRLDCPESLHAWGPNGTHY